MNKDDLKKYSVIVEGGSGCFFQPMTEDYTYILTAKHLFFETKENEQGQDNNVQLPNETKIVVRRYIQTQTGWDEELIPFVLKEGETYFPHKDADIAILKIIPAMKGYDNIGMEEEFDNLNCYELCGYPSNVTEAREYTTHMIENFIASNDYFYSARLFGTLRHEDIEGMSGCGILRVVNDNISVIGIQSKMGSQSYPSGEIGFVQTKYFNEIIEYEEYKNELVALLPNLLLSFKCIENNIFKLPGGVITKNKSARLSQVLKIKSKPIIDSDLTPYEIKIKLAQKIEFLGNNEVNNCNKIMFWRVWLELLTIISIAELHSENVVPAVPLSKEHLPKILEKIRLFYIDSDKCFWFENIDKLHRLDYHGLIFGSTVVVASNVKAEDDMHILEPGLIVEDITRVENKFKEDKILGNIDCAMDFPLKKYKFVNVSAFKEGTVNRLEDDFETKDIDVCINKLKIIYGEILSNG